MENVPIQYLPSSPKTNAQSPNRLLLNFRTHSPLDSIQPSSASLCDTNPTFTAHPGQSELEHPRRDTPPSTEASRSPPKPSALPLDQLREDILLMARPETSISTRKRSRQNGGPPNEIEPRASVLDSPNPKARKQRKTSPDHHESEEDQDGHPPLDPRSEPTKYGSSSKPGPKRRQQRMQPNSSAVPSTPSLKSKTAQAPKTERKTRKNGGSTKAQKSRRKSAPLPLLTEVPQPDSDGEDPLLLVGDNEWVPVPWKPSAENTGVGYVKKEEDDGQVSLEWHGHEPSLQSASKTTADRTQSDDHPRMSADQIGDQNHTGQPPPALDASCLGEPTGNDTWNLSLHHEDSLLLAPPEADSSFVGMEIESDEDVSEFTVPVRLESPPPRRRRSSNVSQREDTPAANLSFAITPTKPSSNGFKPAEPVTTDPASTRAIFQQLLQSTPATGARQASRSSVSRGSPVTPFRQPRRALTASPYPSPRFTGRKLGSLSPEKGVGPSRGRHPKLRAPNEGWSDTSELRSTIKQDTSSVPQKQSTGTTSSEYQTISILPNISEFGNSDTEEDDGGHPSRDGPDQDSNQNGLQIDEETDEEELENSLRVERELTDGLNDDDQYHLEKSSNTPVLASIPSLKSEDPSRSPPRQSFKLFAESPSSDDGLIPLFDTPATAFAQSDLHPLNSATKPALLPPPNVGRPRSVTQPECELEPSPEGWVSESSDDDGPPVVEITSKEPMAAARAAAILKHWHHYSEEQARLKLRTRRSSTTSVNLSTPPTVGSGQTPFMNLLVGRQSGSSASPISPRILEMAEAEVLATPPRSITTPNNHHESKPGLPQSRFTTPLHRTTSIPEIIIDPASSRPSVDEAARQREIGRPWTKSDWKALESCLLDERRRIARLFGLQEKQVDVGEVDVDAVVKAFVEQNRLVGDDDDEWEEEDEWNNDKIRRRCLALQVRHSHQPAGAIVVPGSPLVIPFTPLQSRQTTPATSFAGDISQLDGQGYPLKPQRSISPIVPLSTPLLAPRYVHLYEEAAAIAGVPSEHQSRGSSEDANLDRSSIHPAIVHQGDNVARTLPASRIPIPLPRSRRTSLVEPQQPHIPLSGHKSRADSSNVVPTQATPSTASRVLGFLGLRGILRASPTPTPLQKRNKPRIPSPPPEIISTHAPLKPAEIPNRPQMPGDSPNSTERVLNRVPSPIPVAQVIIPISKSKEDLNHIEPTPPRPLPRVLHPREQVILQPVPPKPEEHKMTKPRRSSGSSVKDLVKTFENLESQNSPKSQSPKPNPIIRRRLGSGPSLRRVPSNLSTCSVISADTLDQDRSLDESVGSLSYITDS